MSAVARGVGLGKATPQQVADALVADMASNLRMGHFTTLPCACKPPCPEPSEEQLLTMQDRLMPLIEQKLAALGGKKR